ncbi:SPOR domain-containing protein [Orbus sturtevantii]|uniref:SPOR domain-containing protein n=1 Tax=Orbus sturtevantii TaxID=3074109 RepID=UPI00370D82A4
MAQRDYVKKKSKAKNSSRVIPNLMMAIAILLVILFAAILYFVSKNNPHRPVSTPQNITEKPQVTLPDKPEERWTYLKELENPNGNNKAVIPPLTKSIQDKERQQILSSFINDKQSSSASSNQATTNTAPPTQIQQKTTVETGHWLLQCGAFKDRGNAESLQAKLTILGMTSFVQSEKFHRVLVGPYQLKSDTEKAIAILKANGINSCIATLK